MAPSFLTRWLGTPSVPTVEEPAIKRLLPVTSEVKDGPMLETKAASSIGLLPVGAYGMNYTFFSPDGGQTIIDVGNDGRVLMAFIAYWYIATRWRAQKIAEAPLMVSAEDQKDGTEAWLPKHPMADLLEDPSPDYDMGELLEITSNYIDNTGACIWLKQADGVGRPAILTPFSRNEFVPRRDDTRLYAIFDITTINGMITRTADQVVFFRDAHQGANMIESSWGRGRSRLDIALSWLRLGARAQQTIYDLLANSIWPSAVITPDKDWDPDKETYDAYKQDLAKYALQGNKGKPFVSLGGGTFTPLTSEIKNLVPADILNRVESVIAAITGVPAIVLQFEVGLINSPWSHMVQARRMAYEDCIAPAWNKIERVLTRQLLRPEDPDLTHFIRFDKTNVDSLQRDQLESGQIAALWGRQASLNERREIMGLEPSTDPKADEIPELVQPSMADILAGNTGKPGTPGGANEPPGTKPPKGGTGGTSDNGPPDPNAPADPKKAAVQARIQRKIKSSALMHAFRSEAIPVWKIHVQMLLHADAKAIEDLVRAYIPDEHAVKSNGNGSTALATKARSKDRLMGAVGDYLDTTSKGQWTKSMQPLYTNASQRAGAVASADMNINYALIHPNLLKFAQRNTGRMITQVHATTKSLVADIVQGGLDAHESTGAIANLIADATGFDASRAELIARTEVAKAFNGAPTESLADYADSTGRTFTKTWSGVLDDRERDEHVEMEGETVPIDEPFSNGMDYPDAVNERCTVFYDETTD